MFEKWLDRVALAVAIITAIWAIVALSVVVYLLATT